MRHQLDDILVDLYSCTTARERFPVVLDKIASRLRVRSAMIHLVASAGADYAPLYLPRWVSRDSGSAKANALPDACMPEGDDVAELMPPPQTLALVGTCVREQHLFRPGTPALARLHERLHGVGLGLFMGSSLPFSDHERLNFALHRHVDDHDDFDSEDERFTESLMPHFYQAIHLADRFDAVNVATAHLGQAIDYLRCGLVICDADARPCWWNAAGRRVLERRDCLWVSADRLVGSSWYETIFLRRMVAEAASAADAAPTTLDRCLLLRPSGTGSAVQVLAMPLNRSDDPYSFAGRCARRLGRVLLMLASVDDLPRLPEELIAKLFNLSPVESQLTVALFHGATISEYAKARGVSVGTARFQLKQILAKTGTRRQSELLRCICLSVIAQTTARDTAVSSSSSN